MNRRDFLQLGGALTTRALLGSSLFALACDTAKSGPGPYGPLLPPDANGIMLPEDFRSRVVARSLAFVGGTRHVWHRNPDGGAVFRSGTGWIYVSNAEGNPGGAGAIRFDADGVPVDAYPILAGTIRNCAGGPTPWGTWLSCEEWAGGRVFECDPEGARPAVVHNALGTFQHEAATVDAANRRLYLTEDRGDGRFYRFTPNRWEDLSSGPLEVAQVHGDRTVTWHTLANPNPSGGQLATRRQVPASTAFSRGEGIVIDRGHVYFATTGDDRIWDYDIDRQTMHVLYAPELDPAPVLSGVDNLAVSRRGDLLVAEDRGNMELVMITSGRVVAPLLRIVGQSGSEITGSAFDPKERRLYLSSQRGANGNGITYEITGPFQRRIPA